MDATSGRTRPGSGGPEKMRFYMNWSIANLSIIFTGQDIGRPMTDEEKAAH